MLFNNRVRSRPAVLCRCSGTGDVVAAVRFARETGLPVSIRGEHPVLFWALRGAGGAGFGVVTALKYRLDPVPGNVFGGVLA